MIVATVCAAAFLSPTRLNLDGTDEWVELVGVSNCFREKDTKLFDFCLFCIGLNK